MKPSNQVFWEIHPSMTAIAEHFHYLREADPGGTDIAVWVPSEEVLFLPLARPSAPRGKWPKLLPWLLEDHLLSDPAEQHVLVAEQPGQEQIVIVATARDQLKQWQGHCSRLGYQPRAMVPDVLALPWEEGTVTVYVDGERVLVRLGHCEGFASEAAWAWSVLRQLDDSSNLLFFGEAGQAVPADLLVDKTVVPLGDIWQATPVGINLLQGEFASRQRSTGTSNSWFIPALAASFALLCYLSWLVVDAQHLERQTEQLVGVMKQDFVTLYGQPLDANMGDLRSEVGFQLRLQTHQQDAGQDDLWALLTLLDPLLSSCADCSLQSLTADGSGILMQLVGEGRASLVAQLQAVPSLEVKVDDIASGGSQLTLVRRAAR
jgi:general secretion pathway protein L